jgi:GSH-dependent disulfide-bond oxidoreductase
MLPKNLESTMPAPLELFYWPTPNGHKITLLLEELGLPYEIRRVDIGAGDQFKPDFLAIAPNNRMPALIDHAPADGGAPISVFESGAILLYLAEKAGRFIPSEPRARKSVLEWLFWQMAGFGPMLGQNHHFSQYAPEKIPYAIERYQNESRRLYRVLNDRLQGRDFIADMSSSSEAVAPSNYSIADMACYPWSLYAERQGIDLTQFPNIIAWQQRIAARPATERAYAQGAFRDSSKPLSEEAKKMLFGQRN